MKATIHFSVWGILGLTALLIFKSVNNRPAEDIQRLKGGFQRPTQVPFPERNPFTQAKYTLGKTLFFDPRLSSSNMLACASCHNPGLSFTDGNPRAVGHGHQVLGRKTPTILNVAWATSFFWDGRARSLEEQALGPISGAGEMNMKLADLPAKLGKIDGYKPLFKEAFGSPDVTVERVTDSIATFERTIVTKDAPFDRWIAGEETAISAKAKRGFVIFNTSANCVSCHAGWRFTNDSFAEVGMDTDDIGRAKVPGESKLKYFFKTPTLRNISVRAPYMHDGSLKSLEEVVHHYDTGGTVVRPMTKLFLKPLHLTAEDQQNLISFLETLVSEESPIQIPSLPRITSRGQPWQSSVRRLASEY